MLKVYQNLSGFQFNSKLSTWIGRIAYNSCLNHIDKKSIENEITENKDLKFNLVEYFLYPFD